MSSELAGQAAGGRIFALVAAAFVAVPCAAAPRCDKHIYFEGCPSERVALADVLVEHCSAVDPAFERKLDALKRKRDGDRASDDRDLIELRKSAEYQGALNEAEDWFDSLSPASKKEFCDVR